jgi:hypothetical protein
VKIKKKKLDFESRHHRKLFASELQSASHDTRPGALTLKEMLGVSSFENTKTNLHETSFIHDLR